MVVRVIIINSHMEGICLEQLEKKSADVFEEIKREKLSPAIRHM